MTQNFSKLLFLLMILLLSQSWFIIYSYTSLCNLDFQTRGEDEESFLAVHNNHEKGQRSFTTNVTSNNTISDENPFIFPSPRERVKYYMGSWYDAHISYKQDCTHIPIASTRTIPSDQDTLYTLELLNARLTMAPNWLACYLKDAANVLSHVESNVEHGPEISKLVLLRIGDSSSSNENLPVVAKSRRIVDSSNESKKEYSPIIWPIRMNRHFDDQLNELKKVKDTSWEKKRDAIVWRGGCTGVRGGSSENGVRIRFAENYGTHPNEDINIGMSSSCAAFGASLDSKYQKKELSMEQMLKYKYILSLEGNDVATGLKWQLASSSTVFMPKPTAESYAMEALLVPFVHYIPVKHDATNVEEMVTWAKANDDKVRWISEQASKYMDNLWLSDKAQEDNILIRNKLANVYHENFGNSLWKCFEKHVNQNQNSKSLAKLNTSPLPPSRTKLNSHSYDNENLRKANNSKNQRMPQKKQRLIQGKMSDK